MRNFAGMMTFETRVPGLEVARRMVDRLKVVHYAVSLGHHRSLIYWIPTDAIMASTFRHERQALERYRAFAGEGIFRFSVGIEDADDICADLQQVL
jgi:methionine-gamma-lyase